MAISVDDYLAAVRTTLPEARGLLTRLAHDQEGIGVVWQINNDLTHLLVWAWRSGDLTTCERILGVMEQGLINTDDGDDAPVWNSVGIGVVETVQRDLAPEDFAAFVETWPPALREQGLLHSGSRDDEAWWNEKSEEFQIPIGKRVRWVLRHPIRTRLGTRIRFAG